MQGFMEKSIKYLVLLSAVITLSSCFQPKKIRSYKEYENKKIQFDQAKYNFPKDFPPVQRYYNKKSLFRPKK